MALLGKMLILYSLFKALLPTYVYKHKYCRVQKDQIINCGLLFLLSYYIH